MKIQPLAFDSLGVRSVATFVETKDVKILIDPGAALGPQRFRLPPHPRELRRLEELSQVIREYVALSDVLILTHYHYDHYFPNEPELFRDKIALVKHPEEKINKSQWKRSHDFLPRIEPIVKRLEFADNREFRFGKTRIKISHPLWHGPEGTKLGWVIIVSIDDGKEKFLHGSDAQGPSVDETTEWIIKENPDIAVIDGCATLFIGWRSGKWVLEASNENDIKILTQTKVETLILDHHLVRDLHYKNKIQPVLEKGNELNKKVITAAEFLNKKPVFLEAWRKKLYEEK